MQPTLLPVRQLNVQRTVRAALEHTDRRAYVQIAYRPVVVVHELHVADYHDLVLLHEALPAEICGNVTKKQCEYGHSSQDQTALARPKTRGKHI